MHLTNETILKTLQRLHEQVINLDCLINTSLLSTPPVALADFPYTPKDNDYLSKLLYPNLLFNLCLWKLEDQARDPLANDTIISSVKRRIDGLNQARNDQIEQINLQLVEHVYPEMDTSSLLVTETPGSVFDRMAIMTLKKHFLGLEADKERPADIKELAQIKKDRAVEQLDDLYRAYIFLHHQLIEKKAHFKLYQQLKLYNDKKFNPYLQKA